MSSRRRFLRASGILLTASIVAPKSALSSVQFSFDKMAPFKPNRLKAGDTVAITSPAGAVWDEKQIETFTTILKGFGFKVILGDTLYKKSGYFAGTDDERAKEINTFFADKNINGIFCMKGGWGCARILDKIDYSSISKNPKVIIGFSDITSLLIAIQVKTGLFTFHGPVGNSGWNDFTYGVFKDVVVNAKKVVYPLNPSIDEKIITLNAGKAKGNLIGGNLSVLTGIIGSKYLPNWENKILFLEEAKEEPYRIDRMLTQLKLAGILDSISGFVFGKCTKCDAEEPLKAFTTMEVIEQHIKPLGIPAFYGAAIGHIENKLTLPIGCLVEINADKGTITLLESGTY